MKQLLNALFLLFSLTSFAQSVDLKGHVTNFMDKSDFGGVNISLLKEGKLISGCVTDRGGNYEFKNIPHGTYDLRLTFLELKEKLIQNLVVDSKSGNLNIVYPDPCKVVAKICPYGHKDHLIPIVYGYPSKKLMQDAQKGRVYLGGCIVSYCDPKWYCKIHDVCF